MAVNMRIGDRYSVIAFDSPAIILLNGSVTDRGEKESAFCVNERKMLGLRRMQKVVRKTTVKARNNVEIFHRPYILGLGAVIHFRVSSQEQ